MVEPHFNDPAATANAKELGLVAKKVSCLPPIDMPFITNLWFHFAVALVGTTLRPPNLAKGYTPGMAVLIYPNTNHAGGRAPVQSITPFPVDDCYHWLESMATVRLRRKADLFDEENAVQIKVMQHVGMERRFGEDFERSVPLKTAQNAREPLLASLTLFKTGLRLCPFFLAQSVLRPKPPAIPHLVARVLHAAIFPLLAATTVSSQSPTLSKRTWGLCRAWTSRSRPRPDSGAASPSRPLVRVYRPSHGRQHSQPARVLQGSYKEVNAIAKNVVQGCRTYRHCSKTRTGRI